VGAGKLEILPSFTFRAQGEAQVQEPPLLSLPRETLSAQLGFRSGREPEVHHQTMSITHGLLLKIKGATGFNAVTTEQLYLCHHGLGYEGCD